MLDDINGGMALVSNAAVQASAGAGMALGTKILIGAITATMVISGAIAIPRLTESPKDTTPPVVSDTQTTAPDSTNQSESPIDSTDSSAAEYSIYYSSVLDEYRAVVLETVENPEDTVICPWNGIWEALHHSGDSKKAYGYALKDLNENEIPELILLNRDCTIFSIYSLVDGVPYQLGDYWPRNHCELDSDGMLYISGSNGASDNSDATYKISPDSKNFTLIEEVGVETIDLGERYEEQYYRITGKGDKIIISEAEAKKARDLYTYGRTKDAGLVFISLFDDRGDN